MNLDEQQQYQLAYRMVERKQMRNKFAKKLLTFAAVNAGLVFLDFRRKSGRHWSLLTMTGWGLSLLSEYEWEKRTFDKAMLKKEKDTVSILKKIQ
ncbi:2TM domain-containing protein [Algoriphagus halophytocola]|uniref:2TM domain-containing protein n=1 Tax=Algoriphagus halophytocola TaxID=2991499 RepID=A0ABY6MJ42_9BACT|nr:MULTISPECIES: 2TM domain-containing protein [unclassified Algoriphagus]UZD23811.1 2TM domain-containing protein [Algoriphagus sp. TR-M5]WBL41178.1 2TM domain-containing protein [Algoriphagus sp. TR-M9]